MFLPFINFTQINLSKYSPQQTPSKTYRVTIIRTSFHTQPSLWSFALFPPSLKPPTVYWSFRLTLYHPYSVQSQIWYRFCRLPSSWGLYLHWLCDILSLSWVRNFPGGECYTIRGRRWILKSSELQGPSCWWGTVWVLEKKKRDHLWSDCRLQYSSW